MKNKDLYCPFHNEKLVLRVAKQGKHKGKKFCGCPTWSKTKCNYTIPYDTKKKSKPTLKQKLLSKIKNKKGKISPLKVIGMILITPIYLLGMLLASNNKVFSNIRKKRF